MPVHESIHEYYLHQHRNIQNYLELCMVHADKEVVHELRLSIKKLRAFHKLAEELCPAEVDELIHINKRVRRLFRLAGQLRDTQVQIHMLVLIQDNTEIDYPEFSKWLLKREKKRILRFGRKPLHLLSHTTADATLHKIGDWLALASDESILKGAAKVLAALNAKAMKLSAAKMNEQDLHLIRTIIKQIKYILNIMHHSYPDFRFSDVSVDSLHKIETSVGNWHDNLVRVELLDKFIVKSDFEADSQLLAKYQELFKYCKAELNVAYKDAYRIVRDELL